MSAPGYYVVVVVVFLDGTGRAHVTSFSPRFTGLFASLTSNVYIADRISSNGLCILVSFIRKTQSPQ